METFSKDTFEFVEARIVGDDKRAGVGPMGGLGGPNGMIKEGTGNLIGYEGWGISSVEEE